MGGIGHDITVLQIRDRIMALSGLHILGLPLQAIQIPGAYGFYGSDLHIENLFFSYV